MTDPVRKCLEGRAWHLGNSHNTFSNEYIEDFFQKALADANEKADGENKQYSGEEARRVFRMAFHRGKHTIVK